MNGYDKYESGMDNRVLEYYSIDVGDTTGLQTLKHWMNDHGDGSEAGGIAVFAAGVSGNFIMRHLVFPEGGPEPYTIVERWDDVVNHAMTFVGYDDTMGWDYDRDGHIGYDYDEDGIYTNHGADGNLLPMKEWELGALIMVNSWGAGWGTGGKAWVPYRTLAQRVSDGGIYQNEVYVVKAHSSTSSLKLKASIDYSVRSNLEITAGISNNLDATTPEYEISFSHFNKQGGFYGMSGDDNTIELSLDISKLLIHAIPNNNIKYFLSIKNSLEEGEPQGEGFIRYISIIDDHGEEYNDADIIIEENSITYSSVVKTYHPQTYYVNNEETIGDDEINDGLSLTTPFKTISKAIKTAGAGATIILAGNSDTYLTAGTFTLTDDDGIETFGAGSGLYITKSLTIIGESPETTIIQAHLDYDQDTSRIFYLNGLNNSNDVNIIIENLTIQNGKSKLGGGIYSSGLNSLQIENCIIKNNISSIHGGGIYISKNKDNDEEYIIRNCEISNNNTTDGYGHGIYIYSKTNGKTKIDRCTIVENGIRDFGISGYQGMSGVYLESTNAGTEGFMITNSAFVGNKSYIEGGGITIKQEGDNRSTIQNCTISDNTTRDGKGHGMFLYSKNSSHIEINSCTIADNKSLFIPGSVIYYDRGRISDATLDIRNSIVKNNGLQNIYFDSPVTFTRSYTISDDESIPLGNLYDNPDDTDPLLTTLKNEFGTSFYKLTVGSPAKDAIPSDDNYNGAGYTDADGSIVIDDQLDNPVWNQNKDLGSYESPYYWIEDDDPDNPYISDPNHTITLEIADTVEGWDDFINVYNGCEFQLQNESSIEVVEGSNLNIATGSTITLGEDSKITLKKGVTLNLDGVTFNGSGYDGIVGEDESIIRIQNCNFNGAQTAISGLPDLCNVSNSTFVDCINGVNLFGTSYNLSSNFFTGRDLMGTAIIVVQSNGRIIDNKISSFFRGVINVSCSPKMYGNYIKSNARNGLYSSGLNSVPVLTDMTFSDEKSAEPCNTIISNGDGYIGHPVPIVHMPSQISVVNGSNIYMKYCNNYIYPNPGSDVFCMLGAKILQQGPINIPVVEHYVDARGNYWGTNDVTSDMFYTDPYYSIDYRDEVKVEDGIPITSPLPDSDSKSFDLLMKAFEAESEGKYDKSIHFYEKIIKKYPDSEEAMVAYTNLPDSYNEEGLDLEPLISLYDEQLALDDDKVNKKFFKEMKVTTKIKDKKYDEAIAISEEMILEADSEEEERLCEIDIIIANMMKGSDNKGKSRTEDHSKTLNDLLTRLNEGEDTGERTDIAEPALPTEFTLYQNYPNPFNPVTQIKFALPNVDNVRLNIYNISGQLVSELVNGSLDAGIHTVNFDGNNLNSGMYFYTLEANGMTITKKMVLTK